MKKYLCLMVIMLLLTGTIALAEDANLLEAIEEQSQAYGRMLQDDYPQVTLNQYAAERFELWEQTRLQIIGENMTDEECMWADYREEIMCQKAGEYENGSIYALIYYETGTEMTREHVYALWNREMPVSTADLQHLPGVQTVAVTIRTYYEGEESGNCVRKCFSVDSFDTIAVGGLGSLEIEIGEVTEEGLLFRTDREMDAGGENCANTFQLRRGETLKLQDPALLDASCTYEFEFLEEN